MRVRSLVFERGAQNFGLKRELAKVSSQPLPARYSTVTLFARLRG